MEGVAETNACGDWNSCIAEETAVEPVTTSVRAATMRECSCSLVRRVGGGGE